MRSEGRGVWHLNLGDGISNLILETGLAQDTLGSGGADLGVDALALPALVQ